MQIQQNKYLAAIHTLPCAPKTKRGDFSTLDIANDHFLYFNGPTLIVRPLDPSEQIKFAIHKSDVSAAKFSHDGKSIASIDQKGTLHIHLLGDKQLFQSKKYQNFYVNARAIEWSADKKRVCVVGSGKNSFGRVALIESGTNAGQITGVSANLTCCSFRPERPYNLVVGGDQFNLKFYQGPPYKFSKSSQKNHTNYINSVKYSPLGAYIISVSSDKKIVLYNGQNFQLMKERVNCHERSILGLDWIDQKTFLTVSADKTIKIWNTDLEELSQIISCKQQQYKNAKQFDHFQVAVKFYKDRIYSLNLNGQISEYMLPSSQQKIVEFNPQKTLKYAGWLEKPTAIINLAKKNKIIIIDYDGKFYEIDQSSKQNLSNSVKLVKSSLNPTKSITNGFYNQNNGYVYALWGDGNISQLEISQNSQKLLNSSNLQVSQKLMIKNLNAKLISQSFHHQYELFAINTKINALVSDKVVRSSNQFGQDVTFVNNFKTLIIVGTIKGNIQIYNSLNLQLLNKINVSATKVSNIYVENTSNDNQFVLICGDALGKFNIFSYNQQKRAHQQLSSCLGNHQSLITSIIPFKQEYLFTFAMDNKINLWRKIGHGKYSRIQDWRNVHHFGILFAVVNADTLLTVGGELLIKQWNIKL